MKEKTLTSKKTATIKIAALLALKLSKEKSAFLKQAPDRNHFAGSDVNERFQALIEKIEPRRLEEVMIELIGSMRKES